MSTATEPKVDPFVGLPGIFRECVAAWGASHDISTPWVHDGWVYATDGRAAVRTALDLVDPATAAALAAAEDKPGRKPRVPRPWAEFSLAHALREEPTPIPDSVARKATCDECGGNGICYGQECDDCGGDGWVIPLKQIEVVPGYFLAQRYLELIRRHGARLWVPVEADSTFRSVFRGLAFEGVLMAMAPPKPGEDA